MASTAIRLGLIWNRNTSITRFDYQSQKGYQKRISSNLSVMFVAQTVDFYCILLVSRFSCSVPSSTDSVNGAFEVSSFYCFPQCGRWKLNCISLFKQFVTICIITQKLRLSCSDMRNFTKLLWYHQPWRKAFEEGECVAISHKLIVKTSTKK